MEYMCEVCGQKVSGDAVAFIEHTEDHIIEAIKKSHPAWVEKNGLCRKCYEYFKDQIRGGA